MKNVLIISSSPRIQGNSDILCRELEKGAVEAGHKVSTVRLVNKKIEFCKACYACFKTGRCVIKDDMEEIINKIQASDVIVIATPTYFLSMNGRLKTLIDRLLPQWQNLGGHDVYFIITGHDRKKGLELVGKELTSIFDHLGNNVKGMIWGENVWKKGEVIDTIAMKEAYEIGGRL